MVQHHSSLRTLSWTCLAVTTIGVLKSSEKEGGMTADTGDCEVTGYVIVTQVAMGEAGGACGQ